MNGAFPALAIFLLVGFTFWREGQQQKEPPKEEIKKETVRPGIISLNPNNNSSSTTLSNSSLTDQVISGSNYLSKIAEIRRPVNAILEDLNQKTRYSKLFSKDEVLALIAKTREEVKKASEKINSIIVSQNFSEAQKANIKALDLLDEAVLSLREFYETGDEAKLQFYNFKIEESNKIVQSLQIPN